MADAVKKTRGKKGDGPVVVSYVNNKNEESTRVTADVEQIKVADRHGKSKLYPVSIVGAATLKMLAAHNLAKALDLYVRNSTDGTDVLKCADAKIAALKDGKFYSKGEGKGGQVGKPFDYDLYIDAICATADQKAKAGKVIKSTGKKVEPASDAMRDRARIKLMSFATGKERREFIDKHLMSDPVFKTNFLTLQAKQKIAALKGAEAEGDAMAAF